MFFWFLGVLWGVHIGNIRQLYHKLVTLMQQHPWYDMWSLSFLSILYHHLSGVETLFHVVRITLCHSHQIVWHKNHFWPFEHTRTCFVMCAFYMNSSSIVQPSSCVVLVACMRDVLNVQWVPACTAVRASACTAQCDACCAIFPVLQSNVQCSAIQHKCSLLN